MTAQARLLGGRYEIGEILGYGGMAEVHRGLDTRLGRDVAVKMLRTDLARDVTFQTRFRREAQNAASLNHPAIVAVYDTGEQLEPGAVTPVPYIVMEYVPGRTLKELIVAEGPVPPRQSCEIVADICAALDFSHKHQIIHRDIKPGNVMMTPSGDVKVMDFGIARAMASSQATMTQTSAVIGTAQYLSPEQARGETVDARSDVYATGCVLYELLTGNPPFTGDNPVSVAYQHVREQPRLPSEHNPDVPPAIDAIVMKALSKNPVNRYQSAGEMRADLQRAAAGRPVLAPPVSADADRTAIIGAAALPSEATRVAPAARVAQPQKKKSNALVWTLVCFGVAAALALALGLYLQNRGPDQVAVPAVVGMTQKQATEALTTKKFKTAVQQVASDPKDKGNVVKQDPDGGKKADEGSTVTISVGAGPNMVTIPATIVGKTQTDASSVLIALGLKPKFVTVDSDKPAETVVDTDPKPGQSVSEGSEVTLKISKGNMKNLPDVTTMSKDDAVAKLSEAGFNNVGFQDGSKAGAAPGTVTAQDPGPNKSYTTDTRITLTIQKQPDTSSSSGGSSPPGGA
ncbi:serine/threonine protein kinase [Actinorhabdospora filicis]|uniref:non-specific serine/threonine protein kinase n=1 Tax=Actinorhabdospora filicis TaxID=1785913 RepID=A0A9W6SV14_9ACTN|nr:Stk1 family PASTA domain-containing Ser/Thr kinase [Actinorhabdospora filicis]GLZ81266.1 serine/threonine protein kinase [Actinorhabdospora filicis]